jgi:DNA-directed RNA polymerase subunit RPC12/RpoP
MSTTYTCAQCNQEFETDWTDEEASLEFDQSFEGSDIRNAAIVCDDCYKLIMGDSTDVPQEEA